MSSVKKNLLYNLLLLFSNLLFPVVNFAYASRILGPVGIGKVQFVITFASYFVVIAQVGIPVYGIREIAKAKKDQRHLDKLFSELLLINLISSLLMLVVYLIIILSVPWFRNSLDYYLLAGLLVFSGFSALEWFYQGMEQFRFLTVRSVVVKTLALTGLLLFVKTPNDLMTYFLITLGSVLAINLWNLAGLRKQVAVSFRGLKLKTHFKALSILYGSSLTIAVYTLGDTLWLGFLSGDKAVGFYTAAKKLTLITIPLITSLGTVLIPRMAQSLNVNNTEELKRRVKQSFSFICLFGIPVSIGVLFFAPEFMMAFSGPRFSGAVFTLRIIAPGIFVVGLSHLFGIQLLIQGGFEKLYLKSTTYGMIVSLFLNLILISLFQDKGAAAALLITETLVAFFAYFYVWQKMKLRVNWSVAWKALIASLSFLPVVFGLKYLHIMLLFRLSIAVFVSAMLYFVIQIFVFREPLLLEMIKGLSTKGKRKNG